MYIELYIIYYLYYIDVKKDIILSFTRLINTLILWGIRMIFQAQKSLWGNSNSIWSITVTNKSFLKFQK